MDTIKLVSNEKDEASIEIDPAVQRRLRTLIELAVAIGRREGMIGKGDSN